MKRLAWAFLLFALSYESMRYHIRAGRSRSWRIE